MKRTSNIIRKNNEGTYCNIITVSCSTNLDKTTRFENAPTCYRAPKWPDPEFPRKMPKKIPPGPKFWTPRIYPQNTPKIPKKYPENTENAYFGIFSVFLGYFLGVPEFRPAGGIFSVFFVEIPGRAISGLCSRSGRS